MSITYPSSIVTFLDLPEPSTVKAEFVYNYFTTDERRDGSGEGFRLSSAEMLEKWQVRQIPRYVRITWNSVVIGGIDNKKVDLGSIFNISNIDRVQSEVNFSNLNFVGINFHDNGVDGKLYDLVSGSVMVRGIEHSSPVDASRKLANLTRKEVHPSFVVGSMTSPARRGIIKSNDKKKDDPRPKRLKEFSNISLRCQINNRFFGTIVEDIATDTTSIYADEMRTILPSAIKVQENAEKSSDDAASSLNWDSGFVPINITRRNPSDMTFDVSSARGAGFIVERDELANDGSIKGTRYFTVSGIGCTTVIDPEVRYGATYRYRVKSVAEVSLAGVDVDGTPVVMTGLVSSQASAGVISRCVEFVPPPAPADFRPTWDYDQDRLRLLWSFPVNSQRDIKRFQVFRRKTTSEPFSLLVELNHDDSLDPASSGESVDPSLIKHCEPTTFFVDEDFRKDSNYIYAVCCIDAHGLSSCYSRQFRVKFDRFTNAVVVDEISQPGSPKPFPNMFLEESVFVDSAQTSGMKSVSVYFDPTCTTVNDQTGKDLDLLRLGDPKSRIRLSIIDVDLVKDATVDVHIKDLRTNSGPQDGAAVTRAETNITSTSDLPTS